MKELGVLEKLAGLQYESRAIASKNISWEILGMVQKT
jgi:hypothetical protein